MSEKMWGAEPFWGLGYEWDPDWVYTDRQRELRALLIELTPAGRTLVDSAVADHAANEARLLEGLTGDERRQLAGLLRKLLNSLPPD